MEVKQEGGGGRALALQGLAQGQIHAGEDEGGEGGDIGGRGRVAQTPSGGCKHANGRRRENFGSIITD